MDLGRPINSVRPSSSLLHLAVGGDQDVGCAAYFAETGPPGESKPKMEVMVQTDHCPSFVLARSAPGVLHPGLFNPLHFQVEGMKLPMTELPTGPQSVQ